MQGLLGVLSPITLGFIIIICLAGSAFQIRFNQRTAELGPTLLTTTGILGTFVGIAVGLYHFDTSKVEESIPALLDGLKTAFFASVFGVGFAIALKGREYLFGVGKSDEAALTSDEVSGADLIRHLREIRVALNGPDDGSLISQMKLTRQDAKEQLETLRSLQRTLSGSEDGSLLTQLRLLRQDSNDRLDALRATMSDALKKLSEMGSQTLIEALRDVIRDFNDKITEQFGENFKELNVAVGNLLVWQEQYKETVETTVAKLNEVGRLISDLTGNFSRMVERSGRFADVADRLGTMLTALEGSERRLKEQSEALADLLLKASGSLPQIERKIGELSTQMADAVRENQRIVSTALTESATVLRGSVDFVRQDVAKISTDLSGMVTKNQEAISKALTENATAIRSSLDSAQRDMSATNAEFNRHSTQMANVLHENQRTVSAALTESATALHGSVDSLRQDMAKISTDLSGMVTKNQEAISKALTENATAIRTSLDAAQRDMSATNAEFNRQLHELADKTKEQVATLDAALQRELQTALQSLAQQFTAISGRFAQDYGNLADTLKKIVDNTRVVR